MSARQEKRIEPDGPLPRSVMLMRPATHGLPRRAGGEDGEGVAREGSLLPPMPKLASIKRSRSDKRSSSVDIVPPSPPFSSIWNVNERGLPSLPPFFPLERTHVSVTGVSCVVVANRIAECLRSESISARFNDDKATAKAETSDHVRFQVRLFRDSENEHSDGVLVEVQRRSGSSISFHHAARCVLCAAQGLPLPQRNKKSCLPVPPSIIAAAAAAEEEVEAEKRDDVDQALDIAEDLLRKDRIDANVLGMESLRMITDPQSSGIDTAIYASKKILSPASAGDDGHASPAGIAEKLVNLVQLWKLHDDDEDWKAEAEEEDDFDLDEEGHDNRHNVLMHNHALGILANSASVLQENGELGAILQSKSSPQWLVNDMISTLLEEIAAAEKRPHDSYQAVRCINALCRASPDVLSRATGLDATSAAQLSLNEGVCRHALLAHESEDTLKMLRTSRC